MHFVAEIESWVVAAAYVAVAVPVVFIAASGLYALIVTKDIPTHTKGF